MPLFSLKTIIAMQLLSCSLGLSFMNTSDLPRVRTILEHLYKGVDRTSVELKMSIACVKTAQKHCWNLLVNFDPSHTFYLQRWTSESANVVIYCQLGYYSNKLYYLYVPKPRSEKHADSCKGFFQFIL